VVRDKRLGWRLLAATSALALVATACGADDNGDTDGAADDGQAAADDGEDTDDGDAEPVDGEDYCAEGGDAAVRWAHEQEPQDLHLDDPANNLSITSWIQQGMLEGLYGVTATTEFVPELLAEEGEVTENDDGTITHSFTLRDDIQWSDGEPITGETIQGTFEIFMEGFDFENKDATDAVYALSSRQGYELIDPDSWEVDGQSFSYTAESFFAGWPSLFARVLPVHVLDDAAAANDALREFQVDGEPLPASGPFQFSEWNRGVSLSLTANEDYHGSNPANDEIVNEGAPCASGVELTFVTDTDTQVNALRAGEADFIMTQPQVQFGEGLADDPSITLASEPGPVFEHWSLNIANPHLADVNVREALAYAIDKSVVMEALYEPLFGDTLPREGLGATYWLSNSPNYVDHQGDAGYGAGDFDAAAELLEESGYSENGEGFWEHPERGQLTLRVSTTAGNQLRELQQQQLQAQLQEGGIDIQIDNIAGADFFGEQAFSPGNVACSITQGDEGASVTLASGDEATADCGIVDLMQFAWVGGPWPGSQSVAYRTGSENNPHAYSNEDLDALLDECDQTLDDDERADCYNEADEYVTTRNIDDEGLIIIPLTQKPSFYAYSNDTLARGAVAPDANDAGPLAYAVDFLPAN
jgi:peptide/nickel transport system substrate-binding protein